MNEPGARSRLAVCFAFLVLALIGLGSRLACLHLGSREETQAGADRTGAVEKNLLAGRGKIYDCRGPDNIMALNLEVRHVCADPQKVVRSDAVLETASELSQILDLPVDRVAVKLNHGQRRYARIKRYVPEDRAQLILARRLCGVFFEPATLRYYPHGSFLCHVLGFVNHEGQGSAGVEQRMDKYLRGSGGVLESRVNALGQELYERRARYIPPLKGADVCLTIDQNVQYMVEKALEAAVAEHHARGAWAIVQHVRTGAIIAMACRPAFDLNQFGTTADHLKLNRAVGSVYEPGSTMKAVIFSAALNEGTVVPETVIDCEHGAWRHAGRILHDFHPYGKLTVADGIKKSSNIMAAKIALGLGQARLYKYLRAFGFGQKSGIDLPGEETGILHPVSRWSSLSPSRLAIGQGVATTALQMLNAFCVIANDGFLMRPYIVRRVTGRNGDIIFDRAPEILGRARSSETAGTMRALLRRVTEDGGTGRRARVEGYEVAGKTGTAQKAVGGGYSTTAHVASFVGFIPARRPELGVIVVVDEPQPLHTGGRVAGPVFARIVSEAVRYLDIAPVETAAIASR
jgi:cell division protein FtsI (penicillin-binding protein 3)